MITTKRLTVLVTALAVASTVRAAGPLPAFPGAEGFGALATGGRGGTVYHVTNLEDAGPGSLRDAISQPSRIVVFDVAGVIQLKSPLVGSSNLTVAGQSAPGDGVTVFGHGISFSGKSNVIVRHLRLRASLASGRGTKVLNVTDGSNMIFDHLSISWGRWDNIGFTAKARDITLQDSIVSEAIDPQRFGAIIDSATGITVVRTLWANNQSRNPKGKAHMQFVNNVVYNWGSGGYCGGHSAAVWNQDLVGNCFVAGPSSKDGAALVQFTANDHVHQSGNVLDGDRDGQFNPRAIETADYKGNKADEAPTFASVAYNKPGVPVSVVSAAEAYEKVLAGAGVSLSRDAVDKRIIEQVRSGGRLGAIIRDEAAVGGVAAIASAEPPADDDRDGMPDEWESARGLDPRDPADAVRINAESGYSNLEIYINGLAARNPG